VERHNCCQEDEGLTWLNLDNGRFMELCIKFLFGLARGVFSVSFLLGDVVCKEIVFFFS
jgi:hypothetical protein